MGEDRLEFEWKEGKRCCKREADRTHIGIQELQAALKGSNSQIVKLPYTNRSRNLKM